MKYTEEIKKETKIFIVFYEWFYFWYNIDYNYSQNICYEIKEHNIREFTYIKRYDNDYDNDYLEYHDWFGWHEYYRID